MRQAILLPYAVDQNEPSRPLQGVYVIPEDTESRDSMLIDIFVNHVCELEGDDIDEITVVDGSEDGFGDVIVSYMDSVYLFVTFI